jgi:hypothetical protein
MLGVQDFIGYYDWTFEYLRDKYGEQAVLDYWAKPKPRLIKLFQKEGFDGMFEYWFHTLEMEEAGYTLDQSENCFRIDMFDCPSKGFLIKNDLEAYHDYCEHCLGWIKPVMDASGFIIDHEHNHTGQCYWEMHRAQEHRERPEPPPMRGPDDVRYLENWQQKTHHLYLDSDLVDAWDGEQ